MNEYLINCGEFNIIVRPNQKEYFILEDDRKSANVLNDFIHEKEVSYNALSPCWFRYDEDEEWHDFHQKKHKLNDDFKESDLINIFVLKKFNFGSLVARRDPQTSTVKIFKREKLYEGMNSAQTG